MIRSASILGALALLATVAPALAHPHVWVTARSVIAYAPDGRVSGIRHAWTFDEAYSAFALQGLDRTPDGKPSPDGLAALARTNVESLAEFNYFTAAKANGVKQGFAEPTEYRLDSDGKVLTLSFLLPLKTPARADRALVVDIYDPTYFVDFAIAPGEDAVRLADAPKGCALNVQRPKSVEPAQAAGLTEAFYQALSASSTFGAQFANRILVACP